MDITVVIISMKKAVPVILIEGAEKPTNFQLWYSDLNFVTRHDLLLVNSKVTGQFAHPNGLISTFAIWKSALGKRNTVKVNI